MTAVLNDTKIGVIWSGTVMEPDTVGSENVFLFQRVRADEVRQVVARLKSMECEAIIGTPGTEAEIRRHAPDIPLIVAYTTYIDLLESIRDAETTWGLESKRLAVILHAGNPVELDRLQPFSRNELSLHKYHDEQHLREVMLSLCGRHDMIVGGPTSVGLARELSLNACMLIYRENTLLANIEKARELLGLMRKASEHARELEAVIRIFPDGVITTDRTGKITLCNPRAGSILALPEDRIIGRPVGQVTGDRSWSQVYTEGVSQADVLVVNEKGRFFSTRHPVVNGNKVIGSVGTLQEASRIEKLERKYRSFQNLGLVAKYTFADIVGKSACMQSVVEQATLFAQSDMSVLVTGETGTGKEVFAQSIHNASHRKSGPFVAINCATLSETLLESELFGFEDGTFTGARKGGKLGLLERAHTGTVLLDEISEVPLQLQAKLLRVLQEKSVMRVGGDRVIPVNVRVIAASNQDLQQKCREGRFREDLYYRINVLHLELPPLRRRLEDIPDLVACFVRDLESETGKRGLDCDAICRAAAGHDWPGNVRELQNFVSRYSILGRLPGTGKPAIPEQAARQPHEPAGTGAFLVEPGTLDGMIRQLVRDTLERCDGNKSQASSLLRISRNTLNARLKGLS